MNQVCVVGIGNMGSGLAKNLIAAGMTVKGYDLLEERMAAFDALGGIRTNSSAEAGDGSEAAFVMVMNGAEVNHVVFGEDGSSGLVSTMKPGSVIILSATIHANEARELGEALANTGIHLIDTPVSGGYPGAQGGTLTLMASGTDDALAIAKPAMEAVSGVIHRVGTEAGMGQTMKGCLQSVIGSVFSSVFEASVLAAKTGVDGDAFFNVLSTSSAGSVITDTALSNIIDRQFVDTGSHISTMYKDLTISLEMARQAGVPLFTASTATQLFQAGITKHPEGDNWVVTRILEDIVGAKLER